MNKIHVSIRLDPKLHKAIKEDAKQNNRNVSNIIETILKQKYNIIDNMRKNSQVVNPENFF